MQNYNLQTLVKRVQTRLKDIEYDEEIIKSFINEAYYYIVGQTEYVFLETCQKQNARKSGSFNLCPDFQSVIAFECTNENGRHSLEYAPAKEYLENSPNENMYKYTILCDCLHFTVPEYQIKEDDEEEQKTNQLHLYYLAKPMALKKDTQVPNFPEEYSEALVLGALARCERLRDNFDYAQIYENQMEDIVVAMGARYNTRSSGFNSRAKLPVKISLGA